MAKARDRDEREIDAAAGALRRMENALEGAAPKAALLCFGELMDGRTKIGEEALQSSRAQASGGEETSSKSLELDRRLDQRDILIAEARVTLRDHGVEQSAIGENVKKFLSERARGAVIRELELGARP